ncbi:uncharacterized protein ATC70_012007 [Mucor velutinosus]|uniref:Proline dehydrogenase n=2 Tax=Mucor velutinosus TaxID=708070 RepID=A0AAN7DF34_9FUNG|nr:proline dehydrogenase [Mucor velutinosus]KAK4511702.1 hypothetical protein ATC70_007245 [Mucor velutinosus]KAK4514705.1 hypothetical protein ATC70_002307 [Mucor velutinosus]KAK4521392.1 hypothetical protein ATC70_012007 [Mucor velutinosus]
MAENTLPPAANAIPPVAVPNVASTTTIPAQPSPLSLSDLNIHSVPNLPDYLKDIYARLDSQASQISEMQALIQENMVLRSSLDLTKKQLEDAQQRIRQLESQQAPQTFPAPESTAASPPSTTVAQPSFADVAKKQADPAAVKRPKAKTIPRKRLQPLNLNVNDAGLAAARQFSVVSPNHGYRFVYIPNRSPSPISQMRDNFHAMGIHNKRILDIHFPDRHVCGLLVHIDYIPSLEAQLTKYELAPIQFDPMDTTTLRDPKYTDSDPTFLAAECRRLFLARLKVIIGRLKDPHHQLAVARFFCFKQHFIPEDEYAQLAKSIKPTYVPAYKRQQTTTTPTAAEQDLTMGEANITNTTTIRADETSAPVA